VSALLAPPPGRRDEGDAEVQGALFGLGAAPPRIDAPPTLDDVVSRGWEGLRAGVAMTCPVCRGELMPDAGGGRCDDCGTTLS
jgi:hypothetical protein